MKLAPALIGVALAGIFVWGGAAQATVPVLVTDKVTGSPGDWTYDFSVTNNLNGTNDIYFFGVQLATRDIVGSPPFFDPNLQTSWDNSSRGGSSIVYNNIWLNATSGGANNTSIMPGQTLGGFEVTEATATPQSSVPWFAFAFNGTWTGGGNFNTTTNPGFEGTSSAIPEFPTWAMMGLGFAALGFAGYRASRKTGAVAA
jgi:hypothetical protein